MEGPRLPSPPPFTEVQIGPRSPALEAEKSRSQEEAGGSTRRIRPGTRAEDMASGPPLMPLVDLDSAFQLQEHLKALLHFYTHPADSNQVIPLSRETSLLIATPPDGTDRHLWLYELCRILTMKLNLIVVALFNDKPPCSASTCPEMRASEWQYLCACHDPPKSCCAIDYCCHTLDWAGDVLTSNKIFPSRLTLAGGERGGSEAKNGPNSKEQKIRQLTMIFRRIYRILAHAWFQHNAKFWEIESEHGLYVFFKTVCVHHHLMSDENFTIPSEAEGIASKPKTEHREENLTIPSKAAGIATYMHGKKNVSFDTEGAVSHPNTIYEETSVPAEAEGTISHPHTLHEEKPICSEKEGTTSHPNTIHEETIEPTEAKEVISQPIIIHEENNAPTSPLNRGDGGTGEEEGIGERDTSVPKESKQAEDAAEGMAGGDEEIYEANEDADEDGVEDKNESTVGDRDESKSATKDSDAVADAAGSAEQDDKAKHLLKDGAKSRVSMSPKKED